MHACKSIVMVPYDCPMLENLACVLCVCTWYFLLYLPNVPTKIVILVNFDLLRIKQNYVSLENIKMAVVLVRGRLG